MEDLLRGLSGFVHDLRVGCGGLGREYAGISMMDNYARGIRRRFRSGVFSFIRMREVMPGGVCHQHRCRTAMNDAQQFII